MFNYINTGKLERTDGSSITEGLFVFVFFYHTYPYYVNLGIGQGRVTNNLQGAPIDEAIFIKDQDTVNMVRKFIHTMDSFYIHVLTGFQASM